MSGNETVASCYCLFLKFGLRGSNDFKKNCLAKVDLASTLMSPKQKELIC